MLGRVNYFNDAKTRELLEFNNRIGYDDPRFHNTDCEMCGPSIFANGNYGDFVPEPYAFPIGQTVLDHPATSNGHHANGSTKEVDMEKLVQLVTDQVMAALQAGAV